MAKRQFYSGLPTASLSESVSAQPLTHRRWREKSQRNSGDPSSLKILIIEDDPGDYARMVEILKDAGHSVTARRVQTESSFVELLRLFKPHAVISKFKSMQYDASSALSILRDYDYKLPLIVITAPIGEIAAVQCIKDGAYDLVLSDDLLRLPVVIKRATDEYEKLRQLQLEANSVQKSYEILRQMTENVSDILFVVSLDHNTHFYTSTAFDHVFGFSRTVLDVTPKAYLDAVHPEDRDKLIAAISSAEHGYQVQFRIIRHSGEIRLLSVVARPFFVENAFGLECRVCGVVRDITERIRRIELEQNEKLIKQKEEFVTAFSHDLKNPLIGAGFVLDLLLRGEVGDVPKSQRDLLNTLRDSNERMLNHIQSMLEITRMESDRETFKMKAVDLKEIIVECAKNMAIIAQRKSIDLRLDLPASAPIINADSAALYRVIQNLLDNAIKFSDRESTVRLSLTCIDQIKVAVTDSGAGIAQCDQQSLFQRFKRAGEGSEPINSTGLGLYLCKQIIEAHKGTIACVSDIGAGTTIAFCLPAPDVLALEDRRQNQPDCRGGLF